MGQSIKSLCKVAGTILGILATIFGTATALYYACFPNFFVKNGVAIAAGGTGVFLGLLIATLVIGVAAAYLIVTSNNQNRPNNTI
ncbi:TMEM199/VMA12 family vacuolar ATPase assembly factor [Priestia sp. TSO9]|uniref:TMEM199/VMA12 family vacuolar ATPase assembly factor n=1 Tax=Priestia sp. TSO9 TaxID=2885632 RepID=UPI001E5B5828|nr:TMEM199/VMA12 family vacuolar ATPase assembly factor [Priestia sp. TSO9]